MEFLSMPSAAAELPCKPTDMRILVVEDDAKIASFVVNGLKQNGFAVDRCADGDAAHDLAATTAYDAAGEVTSITKPSRGLTAVPQGIMP